MRPMSESSLFDDRVDTDTELTTRQTFALLGRSVGFLKEVRVMLTAKFVFAVIAVLPPLLTPYIVKIIVDQVVLGQPFDVTEVKTPLFLLPFVDAIRDFSPSQIMLSVTGLLLTLLFLFGFRAPPAEMTSSDGMPRGFDAATQSEQALSQGGSGANGLWGLAEGLLTIRMTQRLANSLRTLLMGRLSRLEMTTLDDQRIGDSIYRVMYDAPSMPDICFQLTVLPVLIAVSTSVSIYLMTYSYGSVAPELVWISAAVVPLTLILTAPLAGFARKVHQASRASGATTTNSMEESIDNMSAVQSLGGGRREVEKFESKSNESFRRYRHTVFVYGLIRVITWIAAVVAMSFAFVLISDDVIVGTLTPGDYAVLIGVLIMLADAGMTLGSYWINLQANVAAVRRVFFFIDYTSESDRTERLIDGIAKDITLDRVSFAYPDGRQALFDVSLKMEIGEVVAVVGPTGSGKTTFAYLLPGYIRPTIGGVLFDNVNMADADVRDLRDEVTYVFQEHMLLPTSIRDNLLLANPEATDADLVDVCRIAGATEFIEALPDGIDTVIGKSGDTLSVGQKQRLSIARGLIRKTPVIILDEPTAALDPKTENALMNSLREVSSDRLVIVIAHRLSTVKKADRIIFLEDGKVAEDGDHSTLMRDPNGRYRQFVELQSL